MHPWLSGIRLAETPEHSDAKPRSQRCEEDAETLLPHTRTKLGHRMDVLMGTKLRSQRCDEVVVVMNRPSCMHASRRSRRGLQRCPSNTLSSRPRTAK